jgi:hypothetical protein
MTWKSRVAALTFAAAAVSPVTPAVTIAHAQAGTQPSVQWRLEVIRDGQQIDSFDGTTTVGQAHTDTHHHVIAHAVGCLDHPGGDIDLARTLTLSPTQASATEVTLAIDAQETLEESAAQQTPQGCRLPPQPRQVNASHPGLRVPAGEWVTWQIVEQDPSLAYRVRAGIAPLPAQSGQ